MFENEKQQIEEVIIDYFNKKNYPNPTPLNWTPVPFTGVWGISTNFFKLAAGIVQTHRDIDKNQLSVPELARQIASELASSEGYPESITRIEAANGYLNLIFDSGYFSARIIQSINTQGSFFGKGEKTSELIMVEFSQPNTHKAFHVGHLRSAILGDVLCRILEFSGNTVVRANYFGDIGLHVIKWLWNYIKYHQGELPPPDTTRWMGELYAEATRRIEDHPEFEEEVREIYQRWDQGDPEIVDIWNTSREWSINGFNSLYKTLDIQFDREYANSEAEKPGKQIVTELINAGIADDERPVGPVIVKIDEHLGISKEKYRVLVILRSDGTALYATLDLALAKIKFSDYPLSRSIYVVDVRQSLHFQQVFKTLEIAGYEWAKKCEHLPYELVILPGNVVMASREGTVVLLEDLINEATERARQVVEEKNPSLTEEEKNSVAQEVGIGAIKYPILARENTKVVTFDWETALDFNGQAAPYIQYAHVRAASILRKSGNPISEIVNAPENLEPTEIELVDLLSRFPMEVKRAAEELKPLIITNIAFETAKAFNNFYNTCPVLTAESSIRDFRLNLVQATKQVIANQLQLLGIKAPELM